MVRAPDSCSKGRRFESRQLGRSAHGLSRALRDHLAKNCSLDCPLSLHTAALQSGRRLYSDRTSATRGRNWEEKCL